MMVEHSLGLKLASSVFSVQMGRGRKCVLITRPGLHSVDGVGMAVLSAKWFNHVQAGNNMKKGMKKAEV